MSTHPFSRLPLLSVWSIVRPDSTKGKSKQNLTFCADTVLSGEGPGYERIALGAKVKDLVLQQGMTGDKLAKALAFRMSGRPTPRAPPPQQRNPTQPYNMNRSDLDWTDGSDSLESPGSGWE